METKETDVERRSKHRFGLDRELRYRVLNEEGLIQFGAGRTRDISSSGVAFASDVDLPNGCFVELSISWPAMLNQSLPMRLIVFGRILRSRRGQAVASIEKYEFRTGARALGATLPQREDSMLRRWVDGIRKEYARLGVAPCHSYTLAAVP